MAVLTYKCINCGGPLVWDAERQKYFCDYCNSEFTQNDLLKMRPASAKVQTEDDSGDAAAAAADIGAGAAGAEAEKTAGIAGAEAAAAGADGTKASQITGGTQAAGGTADKTADAGKTAPAKMKTVHYICPSCGAEIVTGETTAASTCYYCHNPVVLSDKLSGDFEPDYVIPFAIDRDKALEIFNAWMKNHKYIPADFYNEEQIENLRGVYFPYWVYNCTVRGTVEGDGRKLRTWVLGSMQYTETSVFDINKSGDMQVQNVTRIALRKASKVLCESVMPFEMKSLQPFSAGYLQGFVAEARDIEAEGLSQEVEAEIQTFAKQNLRESAGEGYSSVDIKELRADIAQSEWNYALLPVWTVTYKDQKTDKMYYFSINGQTGKTCGELPVDDGKLYRLFGMIFVPAFIAVTALLYFIG